MIPVLLVKNGRVMTIGNSPQNLCIPNTEKLNIGTFLTNTHATIY